MEFYVALHGSDRWSGRLPDPNVSGTDGPFATLERARDAIRVVKKDGELHEAVRVSIRAGSYYRSEPFVLTAADSGTRECPITYTACPGETAVLCGSKQLTAWVPHRDHIVRCVVPEVTRGTISFRQLFWNGQRQMRARHPSPIPGGTRYDGWAFVDELVDRRTFRYSPNAFPETWVKPEMGEVNIFPWLCWNNDIVPVAGVDFDRRTVTLARPFIHRLNQASPELDFMSLRVGNRFCIENVLDFLDQPGEWCLDRETGTVYFWPPEEPIQSGIVTVPIIPRLVELRGSTGAPVRYVCISELTLTQTLALFPRPEILPHNYPNSGGSAIYMEGTEHCAVQQCVLNNVGGDGVRLQHYNAENRIVDNVITHSGAQGVSIVGHEQELPAHACWDEQPLLARLSRERPRVARNVVSGNTIQRCGEIEKRGSGVYIYGVNSISNVVADNRISDMPHRGIMVTHGFGRVVIEDNKLERVSLETSDTGGINTLVWYTVDADSELSLGIVIRRNTVRDVVGCAAYGTPQESASKTQADGRIWTPYYSWGIYLDWNPTKTIVDSNVVIGNTLGGIMMLGRARDVVIENNIFAGSVQSQIYFASLSDQSVGNRFVRNIVYYRDPKALLVRLKKRLAPEVFDQCDYNTYHNASGGVPTLDLPGVALQGSFAEWQRLGFDTNSLIADPLFHDPENGDYRLSPSSPALSLGFKPENLNMD